MKVQESTQARLETAATHRSLKAGLSLGGMPFWSNFPEFYTVLPPPPPGKVYIAKQSDLLRINYDNSQKIWKPKASTWFISPDLIVLMLCGLNTMFSPYGGWFAFLSHTPLSVSLSSLPSIPRAVGQYQLLSSSPIAPYHSPI